MNDRAESLCDVEVGRLEPVPMNNQAFGKFFLK